MNTKNKQSLLVGFGFVFGYFFGETFKNKD
jgi:hypothetical protein